MSHLLFEDINSVLSEEYLEEKANVKAMIADFDEEKLKNAIFDAVKAADPDGSINGSLDRTIGKVVTALQEYAPRIQDMLEREDRVVWAIKYLKLSLLSSIVSLVDSWYSGANKPRIVTILWDDVFSKMNFVKKLIKSWGRAFTQVFYERKSNLGVYVYTPREAMGDIELLERVLRSGIKPVEDYVWAPELTYNDLYMALDEIIDEHKKQLKGWAPVDEEAGDKIIIAYKSEKLYWFDLQRPSCSLEGDAAGHCGNSPRSNTDDNVYSLSTLKKVGKSWYRYPHITAVLEGDGLLGEIKGRGNTTPHEKYGDKLVDLCLLPEVKGIGEARWEEEENWTWDHFTEEQQQRILDEKEDFTYGEGRSDVAQNWLDGEGDAEAMAEWLDDNVYLNYNSITNVTSDTISIEFSTDVSDVYRVFEDEIFGAFGDLIVEHVTESSSEDVKANLLSGEKVQPDVYPEDFAREVCLFLSGNASVRAAVQSFKNEFKDNIQYGEWLRRHYANLRGSDKALDKLIDTKFGTILNQKEFDFIEDSEATRAAWAKVVKEAKEFDIFDSELFENLLINASRAVYSAMMESAYSPGDAEWPKFERRDDIPFAYNNIKSDFYSINFDAYGWDDIAHMFSAELDQNLVDNLDTSEFSVNGRYEDYIIDLWEYCFGTENERYMAPRLSSRDPETVDEYKKKEYTHAIYKALSGKEHPLKRS